MRHLLTILVATTVSWSIGQAQNADNLYDNLALQEAIAQYEAKINGGNGDGEDIYNLANAYRLNNQIVKAEKWFSKAVESSENPDAKFYYAQVLLMNGKPHEARKWFEAYNLVATEGRQANVDEFIKLSEQMVHQRNQEHYIEITKAAFNSEVLDYSPMYYGNDLVITSNRSESVGSKDNLDNWTHQKFTDLFLVKLKEDNKIEPFSEEINSDLHESTGTFTSDQRTFYFTRTNSVKNKKLNDEDQNVRLQIMVSHKEKNKWTEPKPWQINNDNYSYVHPAISSDGSMMIFASDQPGGYGGMDLYVSWLNEDFWSVPENLGPEINTPGTEVFPYLDENNKLFFSSNFHAGFGGLDIFEAPFTHNRWMKPKNLGIPINSVKDDFGVIADGDFKEGYFSSTRSGDDEIYAFEKLDYRVINGRVINCETGEPIAGASIAIKDGDELKTNIISDESGEFSYEASLKSKGLIFIATKDSFQTSKKCSGKESVNVKAGKNDIELQLEPGGTVSEMVLCGLVTNEDCDVNLEAVNISILNICTGEEVDVVSDENGQFTMPLVKNCKYKILAEKENFKPKEVLIETDYGYGDCLEVKINMESTVDLAALKRGIHAPSDSDEKMSIREGSVLTFYNIYFDYGKHELRDDAEQELQYILGIMQENPSMKVEISAHTDARSSSKFNKKLSQNRANTAKNWLVDRGVPADNITASGYGETRLKNHCASGVRCTDYEHQRNRRIEFKVVKFNGEVIVSKEWEMFDSYANNK